jgi:hypothetical protein
VGLKISCKIVQKNSRLLISLTISISQSNDLHLSKQGISLSSLLFDFYFLDYFIISVFLEYNFCFRYFLNFFFSFSSCRDFFFPQIALFVFSLTLKSYQLCFFLNFFFRSPLSDFFFFPKSHSVSFSIFCFRSPYSIFVLLSDSFFFPNRTMFLSIGVRGELGGEVRAWGT